jgi:selenocysteine lyase/cysteine desulfurase
MTQAEDFQAHFAAEVAYLNTASHGLPPRAATQAAQRAERDRAAGVLSMTELDTAVTQAREQFGQIIGVPAHRVVIGAQVAQLVGLVAASLPAGAQVLTAEEDFTSLLFPFLEAEKRGVRVRVVPLQRLV